MQQGFIYGYDSENSRWVKVTADSQGRLIIDPSNLSGDYNLSTRTLYKKKNGVNIINMCGESLEKNPWEGAFAIRFPDLDAQVIVEGNGFIYNDDESFSYKICGYMLPSTPSWHRTSAVLIHRGSLIKRVRYGRDNSGNWYIIIGETDDSWDRCWLSINRLTVAWLNQNIENWDNEVYALEMDTLAEHIDRDISDARI